MLVWLASWTLGFASMPKLEVPGRTTYSGSTGSSATLPLDGDFSGVSCEISHNQKCNHMTSKARAIAGSGQIWRYLAKCQKCFCGGKTGKFNAARCGERLEKHVGEACDGEAAGDWAGKQWLCKEGLTCTAGKCESPASPSPAPSPPPPSPPPPAPDMYAKCCISAATPGPPGCDPTTETCDATQRCSDSTLDKLEYFFADQRMCVEMCSGTWSDDNADCYPPCVTYDPSNPNCLGV